MLLTEFKKKTKKQTKNISLALLSVDITVCMTDRS